MRALQDVLVTAPLFANFVEADLMALATTMHKRTLSPDHVLFREGQQGDAMVVVVEGELVVLSEEIDGQTTELARMRVGDIVGEMSALDPAPRSATVKAVGAVSVYVLDRTMLGAVMTNAPSLYASLLGGIGRAVTSRLEQTNKRIREEAFRHLPVIESPTVWMEEAQGRRASDLIDASHLEPLEGFTADERRALLKSSPLVAFDHGEILCAEGRPGHCCFIVGGGELEVLRHAGEQEHLLAVMGPGSVVGQLALLHDTPRSATLRARGGVWVVAIGRGHFNRLINAHSSLGLKLHEQVIVAGIRQLRLASRMLAELSVLTEALARNTPTPQEAPVTPWGSDPTPEPVTPWGSDPTPEPVTPWGSDPTPATTDQGLAVKRANEAMRRMRQAGKPQRQQSPAAERARKARQAWRAVDSGPRPPAPTQPRLKRTPTQEMAIYVSTALEEWGLSLSDLDSVEYSVPEGQMSATEVKIRKG